jgi:hypothetical protein
MALKAMPAARADSISVSASCRLGMKCRILFAVFEAVGRRIGKHMQRIVMLLVGPQGGHRDNAIVELADRAQILTPYMIGCRSLFAVPGVVQYQYAIAQGAVAGSLQQFHSPYQSRVMIFHGQGPDLPSCACKASELH